MITAEGCLKLHDLSRAHDEENEAISQSIENFFAICEIAKKEFIEKTDWALEHVNKMQQKRETLHREYMEKVNELTNKYKEKSA